MRRAPPSSPAACTAGAASERLPPLLTVHCRHAGHGPLPIHLPPIPLPRPPGALAAHAPFLATPAREASRSLSLTFPAL